MCEPRQSGPVDSEHDAWTDQPVKLLTSGVYGDRMAFRYIESADFIAALAYSPRKPRVLLVQPQRLFARALRDLLDRDFTVLSEADGGPLDLILVDADATPVGTLNEIVAGHEREPAICLLSLMSEPPVYARGTRFHVLSKKSGEEQFLAALLALAHDARSSRGATLARPVPQVRKLSFSSAYLVALPGARSGGDWYDVFQANDKIAFIIGDVAGHGIDAALTMSRIRQRMIRLALKNIDPAAIFAQMNEVMIKSSSMFATAVCGYIDKDTREVTYASAGHPPAVLAHASGEASFWEFSGLMLGVDAHASYRTFRLTAPEHAMLVLYTDGVTEHNRTPAESEARFLEAVRNAAVTGALDAAREIQDAVFQGQRPLDDAAILTISFTG